MRMPTFRLSLFRKKLYSVLLVGIFVFAVPAAVLLTTIHSADAAGSCTDAFGKFDIGAPDKIGDW